MTKSNQKLQTPAAPARFITISEMPELTCMDVMHRFLKEFRGAGHYTANTAIFENPAHAVMTEDTYILKLWVTERDGKAGLFDLKYEIEGDLQSDPISGGFLSRFNPVNLFRRPQAANYTR